MGDVTNVSFFSLHTETGKGLRRDQPYLRANRAWMCQVLGILFWEPQKTSTDGKTVWCAKRGCSPLSFGFQDQAEACQHILETPSLQMIQKSLLSEYTTLRQASGLYASTPPPAPKWHKTKCLPTLSQALAVIGSIFQGLWSGGCDTLNQGMEKTKEWRRERKMTSLRTHFLPLPYKVLFREKQVPLRTSAIFFSPFSLWIWMLGHASIFTEINRVEPWSWLSPRWWKNTWDRTDRENETARAQAKIILHISYKGDHLVPPPPPPSPTRLPTG